jgi:hypothetical protein
MVLQLQLLAAIAPMLGAVASGPRFRSADCPIPTVIGKPDDSFAFVAALIDSFGYAKEALSTIEKAGSELGESMIAAKLAETEYACAAEGVEGFLKSKDRFIATSAKGAFVVYSSLIKLDRELSLVVKGMLNESPGRRRSGDLAERLADLSAKKNRTWKLLLTATVAATWALVDPAAREQQGRVQLRISASQRRQLQDDLRRQFGESIEGGMKAGQSSLVGSAALLYSFLETAKPVTE